jgi:hypothetical protein
MVEHHLLIGAWRVDVEWLLSSRIELIKDLGGFDCDELVVQKKLNVLGSRQRFPMGICSENQVEER